MLITQMSSFYVICIKTVSLKIYSENIQSTAHQETINRDFIEKMSKLILNDKIKKNKKKQ